MFYVWSSVDAFNSWHDATCTLLGIPHANRNSATGEIDEDAQWTTAYTEVIKIAEDDWRAYVEDKVAELNPDGLGVPSDLPPAPDDSV